MRFVSFAEVAGRFRGRKVAIVGGAPTVLTNRVGFVDSHDIVVRINNYRTGVRQGHRADVFYSFFGNSIKKDARTLQRDGVYLCMSKVPNSRPIHSQWHITRRKVHGIDFRYIYKCRGGFWFCDTFIPDDARFLRSFKLLGAHIPTTGFAAILDVLDCEPKSVYLTGFDFFSSKLHNVNERWRPGDPNDPIKHMPELEFQWIAQNVARYPLRFDDPLSERIEAYKTQERIPVTAPLAAEASL